LVTLVIKPLMVAFKPHKRLYFQRSFQAVSFIGVQPIPQKKELIAEEAVWSSFVYQGYGFLLFLQPWLWL